MLQVSVYLQNSLHLDYRAAARVVDLTGDSRSVVAVLSSGALQVFSWQGEVGAEKSTQPVSVMAEASAQAACTLAPMQAVHWVSVCMLPALEQPVSPSCGCCTAGPCVQPATRLLFVAAARTGQPIHRRV